MAIGIVGTGSYFPSEVVENAEVARTTQVTDEWIVRKTGIRQRRRAADHEATSDLAAAAARMALLRAGVRPDQLRYILVATSTPDHPQPATAAIVQSLIGAVGAAAFDINAVCSGFVYGLAVAERMLRAEPGEAYGLVVGADIYSRILDYTDRKTAILFGDGAGAVVLGPVPPGHGVIETSLVGHGDQHRLISVPAGGSRTPASASTVASGGHFFRMDGRGVRDFVHETLPAAVSGLLQQSGVGRHEVRHFIPHQANGTMLSEVWPALGLRNASQHLTLARYGNTGAASIPTTLDLVSRGGVLNDGDLVLMAGFGGGMALGATLVRWAATAPASSRELVADAELAAVVS